MSRWVICYPVILLKGFCHGHSEAGCNSLATLLMWLVQAAGSPPRYSRSWVEALNRAGYSVCGIDQQGTGFSEGLECYVERFNNYVDDVLQFARQALLPCTSLIMLLRFLLHALEARDAACMSMHLETVLFILKPRTGPAWHQPETALPALTSTCAALAAGLYQPAACQDSATCQSSWQAARWAAA